MALAAINVKKPREAQIGNCCTGNPVLRILPDSNNIVKQKWFEKNSSPRVRWIKEVYSHSISV